MNVATHENHLTHRTVSVCMESTTYQEERFLGMIARLMSDEKIDSELVVRIEDLAIRWSKSTRVSEEE